MSLFKKYATDKKAEAEGLLYEVTDLFRCRLARLGGQNRKYSERLNELMKPYRRMKHEDIPEKTRVKINLQVFCETVVIPHTWQTWKDGAWVDGIESPQGEIIPATAANYQLVLGELTELRDALLTEALNADNYKLEALQAEAENLSNASNGT